jgi:hypothetical protein
MKICYSCDYENFTKEDVCERCSQPINGIKHEIFNIASFLKRNYQLYAIFGILVVLYEYLVGPSIPMEQKYIGIFPLLVAFYLILYLINKGAQIIKSRHWQSTEELIRRESSFQFIIFGGIHILIIVALVISLPTEARNFMGFFLGMFIFLIFFSANYTYEQDRKTFRILLLSILFFETAIFLFIILPFFAKITDNALFAFCYTWIVQISFYMGVGGMLAFSLITVGYNTICKQYGSFLSILIQDGKCRKYNLITLLLVDIFFGIILGVAFLSLKQLYATL